MLRHVMIRLEELPPARSALRTALAFAKGYGATVTGLYVRPPAPITLASDAAYHPAARLAVAGVATQEHEDRLLDAEEDERQARLVGAFESAAREAAVPYRLALRAGPIVDELGAGMRLADLVVVPRDETESGRIGSPLERLARRVRRPVLVAAGTGRPLRRVAVAYDGSEGACRALAAAADIATVLAPRVQEVIVIEVTTRSHADGERLLESTRYLALYGIPHRTITLPGDPGERILHIADREDVDLLCMGAYGHWAVRDFFLGSVTQSLLKYYSGPILLCH